MTTTQDMQNAVTRLIEAMNNDGAGVIPLAEHVVYKSPLLPEPLVGHAAVREHIGEIAPFVSRYVLKRALFDGDSAALVVEVEGVNGIVFEGTEFLRFEGGRICDLRVYFDTRALLQHQG
jgi:hypothetical protein